MQAAAAQAARGPWNGDPKKLDKMPVRSRRLKNRQV